jgi:hypothetical protein
MVSIVGRAIRPMHKVVVVVRSGRIRSYIGTRHRRKAVDNGANEKAFTAGHRSGVGPEDQRRRVPTHRYRYQP